MSRPRSTAWRIVLPMAAWLLPAAAMAELPTDETPRPGGSDRGAAMIAALKAAGPHPSLGDEARVFDRLVGTWDCDYGFHAEDGSVSHAKGELKFGWIIDGWALQDIWVTYPTGDLKERSIGTTLRFYDSQSRDWRIVFVAPSQRALVTLRGGAEEDRIVLRGEGADGSLLRWSFNEIRPDSFVWRGEKSKDQGATWRLREEHRMTRRSGS